MNTPPLYARPLRSQAVAYAVALCLLLSPLTPAALAQTRRKAKPASIVITQKDPNAVLRPGAGVTFVAKVFSRSGELLEGSEVRWRATGSDAVTVGQFVDDGATHEATLIGFSPDGRQAASALINLTASVANGTVSSTIRDIPFRGNLTIEVEAPPENLAPGESFVPKATVKDGDTVIPDAHVRWTYANSGDRDFVILARDNKDVYSAVALKLPKDKPAPSSVVIVANYGGAVTPLAIPYGEGGATEGTDKPKDETAEIGEILVSANGTPADPCASPTPTPSPASPSDADPGYDIESGRRLTLSARLVRADCKDMTKPLPKIAWSVPKEMSKHVALLEQYEDGRAVFYGLTPESDSDEVRELLYVHVKAVDKGKDRKAGGGEDKDSIKFVKAVALHNGEQTVDVSWNILPYDVVAKNYGRGVSNKFYGIEVVVGNNSGNDLQLTGMSFKLDHSRLKGLNGQNGVQSWVPVASYEVVRAMTEQRKFSFKSRGTILSSLDTAAQILTGFTPYFNVATRARNFSHGINILSNPVAKGIERVWPDPQQDERERLERQALHDDKIVPNGSVYRTTVFFPRDLLGKSSIGASGGKVGNGTNQIADEDDLLAIKERLGQLILVGAKLKRNDFRMRVRQQSFRQPARSSGQ